MCVHVCGEEKESVFFVRVCAIMKRVLALPLHLPLPLPCSEWESGIVGELTCLSAHKPLCGPDRLTEYKDARRGRLAMVQDLKIGEMSVSISHTQQHAGHVEIKGNYIHISGHRVTTG